MTARPTASDDQPELDEAFAEYLLRMDRGEAVDRDSFLSEHANYAKEMGELIRMDELLRRLVTQRPS